jgi:magnesium transporter
MSDTQTDVERARALISDGRIDEVMQVAEQLHPADVAEVLVDLEQPDQIRLLKHIGNEKAAEVLTEVDEHSGQALLHLLSDTEVVSLIGEMPSDDAADIMGAMPPEKSAQIDALLPTDDRERLHDLLEFDEDTAGGIMESETVAVRDDATIADAIDVVRQNADTVENLQDVYVVDATGGLVGRLAVLDLLRHPPAQPVMEVADDSVISVPVDMDQEDVANLFGKYDEFTLPVVDGDQKLVGRITVDDIIDVLEEEATEDIARIAGTAEEEFGETSPLKVSRARLPWLVIAMFGQVLNAVIMSRYETSIATFVVLTYFIPLVIGTAGGTGVQAAVVVVREIAVGQSTSIRIGRRLLRELVVTLIIGVVLGAILFAIAAIWRGDMQLAGLLFVTLLSVTVVSAVVGAATPLLMHRAGIDPAIATGPFITVSCDVIGLIIYLSFATYYISIAS